jgi:hypothetical protein
MFLLNAFHGFHGIGCLHVPAMHVKQKEDCSGHAHDRKKPRSPDGLESAACPFELDIPESQKDHSENLVLKILHVVSDRVPWRLRTKRPNFRVAEDKEKKPRCQEAHWPRVAQNWPSLREFVLCKNKKTCENYEEPCQVMIELTLALVSKAFRHYRGVLGTWWPMHIRMIHSRHVLHSGHFLLGGPRWRFYGKYEEDKNTTHHHELANSLKSGNVNGQKLFLLSDFVRRSVIAPAASESLFSNPEIDRHQIRIIIKDERGQGA